MFESKQPPQVQIVQVVEVVQAPHVFPVCERQTKLPFKVLNSYLNKQRAEQRAAEDEEASPELTGGAMEAPRRVFIRPTRSFLPDR